MEIKFENQNEQSQNLPNGLCLINAKPTLQLWLIKKKNITTLKRQKYHCRAKNSKSPHARCNHYPFFWTWKTKIITNKRQNIYRPKRAKTPQKKNQHMQIFKCNPSCEPRKPIESTIYPIKFQIPFKKLQGFFLG